MSDDVYIKNPFRGRKVVSAKPYVPEHKRLDVEPVEYPVKDPEEFIRMNKKAAAEQKTKEKMKKAKSLLEMLKAGEINQEQFEELVNGLEERNFNPGIVNSGQSEETLWTTDTTVLPSAVYNEDIKPTPQKQEEIIDDLEDDGSFAFDRVKAGEFILIYKENVINVGNENEIKETLTNVLTDKTIKLEDFIILKRVGVGVGVFIND